MKQLVVMLIGLLLLFSCQDNGIEESSQNTDGSEQQKEQDNSAFLVFSSKDDLAKAILEVGQGKKNVATRATTATMKHDCELSSKEIQFVSLIDAEKQRFMSHLSPAQIDSIENDEDQLEYCPSDSVIADYEFAQLLNASREIQVNDTVYKYYGNGVAFTDHMNAEQLRNIDSEVSRIPISENTLGKIIPLKDNVKFMPYAYAETEIEKTANTRSASDREALTLKNGVTISPNDIRDVDYKSNGDGGWLHKTWSRIWGKNVLAINKFNNHKRLRLGFYDQNYIVYANIGTTMKMQKKVCGIWWNCKADEIRVGWSAIELKYTFPAPVIRYLNPNVNSSKAVDTDYPSWFKKNFPFKNENSILFYIPFTSYNIKVKNINSLLKSGIKLLLKKGTNALKNHINSIPEDLRGLYSVDNSALYVITGPDEFGRRGAKTYDKKFYAKWLPGTYEAGFTYNGGVNLKSIYMNGGKSTTLSSGTVYGAVKYKGRWLAARITKSKE